MRTGKNGIILIKMIREFLICT